LREVEREGARREERVLTREEQGMQKEGRESSDWS